MLRDFDEHRAHRGIMQAAFKRSCMDGYLQSMLPLISHGISEWGHSGPFYFFPHIQRLTLDLAAGAFLGEPAGAQANILANAFTHVVDAISAVVRVPVPGLKLGKAVKGRGLISDYLRSRIGQRRLGSGTDLFSQMCRARSEAGEILTDQEIIDHMIFLLFAAHDTTTAAMTSMLWGITAHPEWQEQMRAEVFAVGGRDHLFSCEDLEKMPTTEWALKEALRMHPPVPVYMRKTVKPTTFKEHAIPSGTPIFICPSFTHRMPAWWTSPETFDPARFGPTRAEHKRHPYQWIPFGGGAHMCIGLQFAYMQVKAIVFQMLHRYRFRVEPGYRVRYQQMPLPKPRDGLKLVLERL